METKETVMYTFSTIINGQKWEFGRPASSKQEACQILIKELEQIIVELKTIEKANTRAN